MWWNLCAVLHGHVHFWLIHHPISRGRGPVIFTSKSWEGDHLFICLSYTCSRLSGITKCKFREMPGAAQRKTQERFRLLKNLYNKIDVGLLPYCLQTLTNGVIVSPELCIHNTGIEGNSWFLRIDNLHCKQCCRLTIFLYVLMKWTSVVFKKKTKEIKY